jgi:hypothetical protein
MIRTAVFLTLVVSALGGQAQCALDGSAASGDVITAAVRMWAAQERCSKTNANYDKFQCSWDILAVISSMSSVATTIAHAVGDCATLQTDQCGLATADFLTATTGLATAADAAVGDCSSGGPDNFRHSAMGLCVGDLAGSVQALFGSASALKSIKPQCDDGDNCAQNALGVLGAVASLGAGAAASGNDCDAAAHAGLVSGGGISAFNSQAGGGSAQAACASDIMGSVAALSSVAAAAVDMSKKCAPTRARLFEQSKVELASRSQSSPMLTAMLPVGAFVSLTIGFFVGMRWKKGDARTGDNLVE